MQKWSLLKKKYVKIKVKDFKYYMYLKDKEYKIVIKDYKLRRKKYVLDCHVGSRDRRKNRCSPFIKK